MKIYWSAKTKNPEWLIHYLCGSERPEIEGILDFGTLKLAFH